jgi:hypothetical protein
VIADEESMPTLKITKRAVDSLQPSTSQAFVWDTEVKGFGLKVTAKGKRTYIFQYRTGGREAATQRVTIGEHGSPWSPDSARKEALRLAGLVRQGGDPREDARQRRKAAVTLAFSDYADFFVERYLKVNWKTWREAERILNRDVKPVFRRRPLPSITKADIDDLLGGMDDRPALKRQAYAILNKLFNWAMKRWPRSLSRPTRPHTPSDRISSSWPELCSVARPSPAPIGPRCHQPAIYGQFRRD